MRSTSSILYGVAGQTLEYRVPQGRPASGTFEVFTDTAGDDGTVEFSGSVVVDTVATTVAAASGAAQDDPRKVTLASVAGIVTGRKYLLSESLRKEWGEVVEVGSNFVRLRHGLLGDYTTAATFVSTYVTAAVDNAWAADLANLADVSDPNPDYRVRWEVVVAGATLAAYSYFDLVRAAAGTGVDIADVTGRWPGLHASLPMEYKVDQGRPLIEQAVRVVRLDLTRAGIDIDSARDDDAIDELVIRACLRLLAEGGMHPRTMTPSEFVALSQSNYDRFFEQHVQSTLRIATAAGADSGADLGRRAEPYWVK